MPHDFSKYEQIDINFQIDGIILDSPYSSFDHFVKDNLKKFINFLPGLLAIPISSYLKKWFENKLNIDLNKKQNIDIIKLTNLNTLFIISDKDELIPKERFDLFVLNFAS